VEEEEYPGPESTEPSESTVPHRPSAPPPTASQSRQPRGSVVGAAVTSRGAGWFVASILAGAVTALSILVAAGPAGTVVETVSGPGGAVFRQAQAAPRFVQVPAARRAFIGSSQVPVAIGPGGARAGGSFTVIGPGGGPFGIGGLGCPAAVGAIRPGGMRVIYLPPKALRVARLKGKAFFAVPAGKRITISLKGRPAVVLRQAPMAIQIFRSVHGKRVVTRVLAPQAIAGRCQVNWQVVAPPGK
jgi:hypothetical protein